MPSASAQAMHTVVLQDGSNSSVKMVRKIVLMKRLLTLQEKPASHRGDVNSFPPTSLGDQKPGIFYWTGTRPFELNS